jgi:hypothetical protein
LDPLVPNQVRYRTAPHSEDVIILRRGAKVNDACVGCGNRGCGLIKVGLSAVSMDPRVREDDVGNGEVRLNFTNSVAPPATLFPRLGCDLVCDAASH